MVEVRNYIRGEWLTLRDGKEIEVRNPANLDEIVGKDHEDVGFRVCGGDGGKQHRGNDG